MGIGKEYFREYQMCCDHNDKVDLKHHKSCRSLGVQLQLKEKIEIIRTGAFVISHLRKIWRQFQSSVSFMLDQTTGEFRHLCQVRGLADEVERYNRSNSQVKIHDHMQ